MKLGKWFWGLFFLAAGASIIFNQFGYFGNINLMTLVITIFIIPIIIKSITRLNFAGIFFPIAILAIIYAKPLNIEALTPWPILLTALCASIGFSILFPHSKWYSYSNKNEEHFDEIIDSEDGQVVNLKVSFGSTIKYVNTSSFKKGNFSCSFGAMKVYFDNAKLDPLGAEIQLDVSFGGVELYIPKNWKVVNNTNITLGGIEEKNKVSNSDSPKVILKGNISLSGVEIIYI